MYTETKKVREIQGDRFVNEFKSIRSIGLMTSAGEFFEVKKSDVWRKAKEVKLRYSITDKIYAVKRRSMVLI